VIVAHPDDAAALIGMTESSTRMADRRRIEGADRLHALAATAAPVR
jgi:hypothetical protein